MTLKCIQNVEKIYEAENELNAFSELRNNPCDLVMLDYHLPSMNGPICTREIKRHFPNIKIIAISFYEDEEHLVNMFDNGADGYLLKNTDRVEIERAILSVTRGRHYFSKDIAACIIEKILSIINFDSSEKFKKLNSREKEVLKLLYDECSSKEIASKLFISERTVDFYRQSLIKKTGAKNIVGLVKYAIRNRIVEN
jgi:DNA-binding NarL/FixJ family response regulator